MSFDFSKLTNSGNKSPDNTVTPQAPLPTPAPIPTVSNGDPLDGLFAASIPSATSAPTTLEGATTLQPLFGQGELATAEQFPPLPVRGDVTDPEALEFLSNINTLQQSMGNKAVIGDSIRYIGEELKNKPHLSAVLALHPSHMGLTANALRSAYGLALGASVKRKTKTTKAKAAKAETFGALDSMMGDMDLGGLTL